MQTEAREELRANGYSLLPADRLVIDAELRQHVKELAAEWENLETDRYLKGGSRFRERRYDRFFFVPRTGEVRLRPHRPYFQSMNANDYAGGIDRDVAPLSRATLDNPLLTRLLRTDFEKFPVPADSWLDDPWDVQCHQFRIISTPDETGEPTPEGPHRDEVDFGAIHLMGRFTPGAGNPRSTAWRRSSWPSSPSPSRWTPCSGRTPGSSTRCAPSTRRTRPSRPSATS